jgi:hypothetical protein
MPVSTAKRGHGETTPIVFDRCSPPAARRAHAPRINRFDIVEDPLMRWDHLPAPAFSLCRLGSSGA